MLINDRLTFRPNKDYLNVIAATNCDISLPLSHEKCSVQLSRRLHNNRFSTLGRASRGYNEEASTDLKNAKHCDVGSNHRRVLYTDTDEADVFERASQIVM